MGLATDGKTVFVVGQYKPAGNITNVGYYKNNVLPEGKNICFFLLENTLSCYYIYCP